MKAESFVKAEETVFNSVHNDFVDRSNLSHVGLDKFVKPEFVNDPLNEVFQKNIIENYRLNDLQEVKIEPLRMEEKVDKQVGKKRKIDDITSKYDEFDEIDLISTKVEDSLMQIVENVDVRDVNRDVEKLLEASSLDTQSKLLGVESLHQYLNSLVNSCMEKLEMISINIENGTPVLEVINEYAVRASRNVNEIWEANKLVADREFKLKERAKAVNDLANLNQESINKIDKLLEDRAALRDAREYEKQLNNETHQAEMKIKDIEGKMNLLKKKLEDAENNYENLKFEMEEQLESKDETHRLAAEEAADIIKTYKMQFEELATEKLEIIDDYKKLDEENEKTLDFNEEYSARYKQDRDTLNYLSTLNMEVSVEKEQLQDSIDALKKVIEAKDEGFKKIRESLSAKDNEAALKEITKLKNVIKDTKLDLEKFRSELNNADFERLSKINNIEGVTSKFTEIENLLLIQGKTIKNTKNSNEKLQKAYKDATEELVKAKAISDKRLDPAKLEEQTTKHNLEVENLKKEIKTLEKDIADLTSDPKKKNQMNELKESYELDLKKLTALKDEKIASLEKQLKEFDEKKAEAIENLKKEHTKKIDSNELELKTLELKHQTELAKLTKTNTEIATLEKEIKTLKEELKTKVDNNVTNLKENQALDLKKLTDTKDEKIRELENKLTEFEKVKTKAIEDLIASHTKAITEHELKLKDLKIENKNTLGEINIKNANELEKTRTDLKKTYELEKQVEVNKIEKELNQIINENKTEINKLITLKDKKTETDDLNRRLENQVTTLKDKLRDDIADLKEAHKTAIAEFKARKKERIEEITSSLKNSHATDLATVKNTYELDIKKLDLQISTLNNTISSLKKDMSGLVDSDTIKATHNLEIKKLTNEKDAKITLLEDKITEFEKFKKEEIKKLTDTYETSITELDNKIAKLEIKQKEDLFKATSDYATALEKMKVSERKQLKDEFTNYKESQIKDLENTIAEKQRLINTHEKFKAEATQNYHSNELLKSETADLKKKIASMDGDVADAKKEMDKLESKYKIEVQKLKDERLKQDNEINLMKEALNSSTVQDLNQFKKSVNELSSLLSSLEVDNWGDTPKQKLEALIEHVKSKGISNLLVDDGTGFVSYLGGKDIIQIEPKTIDPRLKELNLSKQVSDKIKKPFSKLMSVALKLTTFLSEYKKTVLAVTGAIGVTGTILATAGTIIGLTLPQKLAMAEDKKRKISPVVLKETPAKKQKIINKI